MIYYIKKYREEKGWSQNQLAAKSGISRSMISAIETGEHHATIPTICSLSRALGKRPDELYDCENNDNTNRKINKSKGKRKKIKTKLGNEIKKITIERGLLYKEVAEILGIKSSYLSKIMYGDKPPSKRLIKNLADFLNMTVNEFRERRFDIND